MGVVKKISEIIKETEGLAKGSFVSTGKKENPRTKKWEETGYLTRKIEDVIDLLRVKFGEKGIVIYPSDVIREDRVDVRQSNYKGKVTERVVNVTLLTVKYVISDGEDSITVVACGTGEDSGDKGPGKAMTYAYKSALLEVFMLATNETDPDEKASEDNEKEVKPVVKPVEDSPEKKKSQELSEVIRSLPKDVQEKAVKARDKEIGVDKKLGMMTMDELVVMEGILSGFVDLSTGELKEVK